MKFLLALIAALAAMAVLRKLVRYKTLAPLLSRRYNFGKRRNTLRICYHMLLHSDILWLRKSEVELK